MLGGGGGVVEGWDVFGCYVSDQLRSDIPD